MSATHPTGEELASLLVRHGIVSADAIEDPDGYDGGMMLDNINKAARELRGELIGKAQQPPTFTAHGRVWIKHTPGDPMPCDGEEVIRALRGDNTLLELKLAGDRHWGKLHHSSHEIIGWNYADPSKEVKA